MMVMRHAAHAHLKRARAFREAQYEYEAQVVLCHRAAAPPARPRPTKEPPRSLLL